MKIIDYETIRADHIKHIQVGKNVKERNQELANDLHTYFIDHGVKTINVMGSVGSGKTSLIEMMAERLRSNYRMGVINGDLATTIDADRVKSHGVEVVQIQTGRMCHLDADLVRRGVDQLGIDKFDLIIVENVGNLICPADFPIGTDRDLVVISVTEGPYMVIKHPLMFHRADVVAINKIDLASVMQVDTEKLRNDILAVKPGIPVVYTNGRTGEGVSQLIEALQLKQ